MVLVGASSVCGSAQTAGPTSQYADTGAQFTATAVLDWLATRCEHSGNDPKELWNLHSTQTAPAPISQPFTPDLETILNPDLGDVRQRILTSLSLPHLVLTSSVSDGHSRVERAFAALRADGSVVAWGCADIGGDSSAVQDNLRSGVVSIVATGGAFAVLKADGSVVTWGGSNHGGDSSAVQDNLRSGVVSIVATEGAFAALKADGSVVTWGDRTKGGAMIMGPGSTDEPGTILRDVVHISAAKMAFAALKSDGSVVTWGNRFVGGNSERVQGQLHDVKEIFAANYAFAALTLNGSVVTWGHADFGGSYSSEVRAEFREVKSITAANGAFAAINKDGGVVTWGGLPLPQEQQEELSSGVESIVATADAFAAKKASGRVISWSTSAPLQNGQRRLHSFEAREEVDGYFVFESTWTGSVGEIYTEPPAEDLRDGVRRILATKDAFAALKEDGSVVTWGWGNPRDCGGISISEWLHQHLITSERPSVQELLSAGPRVESIRATDFAFAALKSDGSVITWGDSCWGRTSQIVRKNLRGVKKIEATGVGFTALKSDGSVVMWGGDHHPNYRHVSKDVQRRINIQSFLLKCGSRNLLKNI